MSATTSFSTWVKTPSSWCAAPTVKSEPSRTFAGTGDHASAPLREGSCEAFVCPYHGWVYELDGRLKAARSMELSPGFDPAAYSLKSCRCTVFEGLIFVNCDLAAAPFEKALRSIEPALRPYDLPTAPDRAPTETTRSRPTGSWRWRTTWSATTARPRTVPTRSCTRWKAPGKAVEAQQRRDARPRRGRDRRTRNHARTLRSLPFGIGLRLLRTYQALCTLRRLPKRGAGVVGRWRL